jgi:hypothetical protein
MKPEIPTIRAHWVGNQLHVEGAISDAQWEDIVRCLAAAGVDANAVKVACRFVTSMRRWSIDDPAVPKRPLRDVMEEMAYRYILSEHHESPTAKQLAGRFERARVAVERARDLLLDATFVFPYFLDRDLGVDRGKDDDLQRLLTWKTADLPERIASLKEMGKQSADNASTRDYWRELAGLWSRIANVPKYRRRHLCRFLFACSQPLFPEMSNSELERLLDSFVHGFFKKHPRKPQAGKRASKATLV